MTISPDLKKALAATMAKIDKDHGKGTIILGTDTHQNKIKTIPTGALNLDIALGIGGLPYGRIVEIVGPESSGKTTFCYSTIAQAQQAGKVCAFIDMEHSMDPSYAKALGVNMDDLLISQPDYGEQALQVAEALIDSGYVDMIAIDSVAALVPKAEVQGEIGDSFVGLQARMMGQALRKIAPKANQQGTLVLFTNQIREKVGVLYGSPETTPGGRALKFYASIRLDIRRKGVVKDGTNIVGNETKVKIVKNKLAAPYKEATFVISHGTGFDGLRILIDMAVDQGLVKKSGAYFTFLGSGDEKSYQGAQAAKNFLLANPAYAKELDQQVRQKLLTNQMPDHDDKVELIPEEDEGAEE